jgi:DNA-directed RNA polymerase subunit H
MSSLISKIHTSRNILLDILKKRGFDVDDWNDFSVSEIQTLYNNKQLDILVTHKTLDKKIFVKYHLRSRIGHSHVYEYIDDLFELEDAAGDTILKDSDELIIISKDKINATTKTLIEEIYTKDKKFVNIYNFNDYLFNILNHTRVPKHIILNAEEKNDVKKRFNIVKDSEFPEISRFDPVAQAIGLRPTELCKIIRSSPSAIKTEYYRLCY